MLPWLPYILLAVREIALGRLRGIFAGRWVGFATKQKSGNYGAHLTLV